MVRQLNFGCKSNKFLTTTKKNTYNMCKNALTTPLKLKKILIFVRYLPQVDINLKKLL